MSTNVSAFLSQSIGNFGVQGIIHDNFFCWFLTCTNVSIFIESREGDGKPTTFKHHLTLCGKITSVVYIFALLSLWST